MKFVLLLLSLCSISVSAQDRRDQIIDIINQELNETIRLSKQMSNRDPSILLRIAELYLEKARIIKEKENDVYLSISPEKRAGSKKDKFFQNSQVYFSKAQKTCATILNNFSGFKGRGEVYYILAFNAKEFSEYKKAKKYFSFAIKYSRNGDKTWVNSQLALAELYYNDKEFKEAIPLYEKSLPLSISQKWYTKDAYNLAWSYFNTDRYNKAIDLMNDVYEKSSNPKYIDLRNQVQRDLALFYTQAGRTNEAVQFYKNRGENVAVGLTKLARHLIDKGQKTQAEEVLKQAYKNADNDGVRIEIIILQLELYDKFGMVESHLSSSRELLKIHQNSALNDEQLDVFKYHAKKMAAGLQKQVVGTTYRDVKGARAQKANLAVEYFEIVSALEKTKSHVSLIHSAETFYSIKDYDQAIEKYHAAYIVASQNKDNKARVIAINGMLASLAQPGLKKSVQDRYLVPSFRSYLELSSKSEKSNKIYQKLFNHYFEANDLANAEKILLEFKSNFPNDNQTQEAMLAKLMDYHRLKNDKDGVYRWVKRINSGEFKISQSYAKRLRSLLLTMQFENVEKLTTRGEKKNALSGYYEIYADKQSSVDAKKNAAYNIAVLFYELGRSDETLKWSKQAVSLMDERDVIKFQKSLLSITTDLFLRRQFKASIELSEQIYDKLCNSKSDHKEIFFKNIYVMKLAEKQIDEAITHIEKSSKCRISSSYLAEAKLDILKALEEEKRWSLFQTYLNELSSDEQNAYKLPKYQYTLMVAMENSGRNNQSKNLKNDIVKNYERSKKKKDVPIETLDIVAEIKLEEIEKHIRELHNIKLNFPEDRFNKTLKEKFSKLDLITTKSVEVLGIGSGKGIVKSYMYLVESYQRVVSEIRSFEPPNKSAEYKASFKSSMNKITEPLLAKSLEFLKESRKQINENKILSDDNDWFLTKTRVPFKLEYRYLYDGVIMDRGGKR